MDLSLTQVLSTNYKLEVSGTSGDYTLTANINLVEGSLQNVESGEVRKANTKVADFNYFGNLNVTYIGIEETEQQEVNTAVNAFLTAAKALNNTFVTTK
jgi:hypothetical protein